MLGDMRHYVIYVPGIGDNIWHIQSTAVHGWRLRGVRGHFYAMPWVSREPFDAKFARLLVRIDKLSQKGTVSLVGASAGASAVMNAYLERRDKIHKIALICPKLHHPESVSAETYANNPGFRDSMERLQPRLAKLTAADRARMRIYYSPVDRTVRHADSSLEGVAEYRLPHFKHSYAIVYAITVGAGSMLRFLKQRTDASDDQTN